MSWKAVIVGVDASAEAGVAAGVAARIAEVAGTTCQLVHVLPEPWPSGALHQSFELRTAAADEARERVRQALWDFAPRELLDRLLIRTGRTATALRQVVAEFDGGVVVLGGKHHSGLDRWVHGGTSLDVLRTTAVPLLLVTGPLRAFQSVVAAVDQSAVAIPTLQVAQQYATLFAAKLAAVSVIEPVPVVPEATAPNECAPYYELVEEQVEHDLRPVVERCGAEAVVRYGLAEETILQEIAERRADLLVMGSHGKGWMDRLLVGSVTEAFIGRLPTSLLIVPAPGRL